MTADLKEWQLYTYVELGRVISYCYESEDPAEIAAQLKAIARDLSEAFIQLTPSSRPEINDLRRQHDPRIRIIADIEIPAPPDEPQ